MVRAVEDVLAEIGVTETPTLLVLNKADVLGEDRRRELAFRHPEAILVSAITGEGLDELGVRVSAEFERRLRDVELMVPFSEGTVLSELHALAGDLRREETSEGVRVSARLPAVVAERFERYAVAGAASGNGAAAENAPVDAAMAAQGQDGSARAGDPVHDTALASE
jgi:GTP-binding protein HflX